MAKVRFVAVGLLCLMSLEVHAKCFLGALTCPAFPSYTLADISRLWLANGDETKPVHTNQNQCFAAAQDMRNTCKLEVMQIAAFSVNGKIVGQTLFRQYQNPTPITTEVVPPPAPTATSAKACPWVTRDKGTRSVADGGSVKAWSRAMASNTTPCKYEYRKCQGGVLTGTYKYYFCQSLY